MPLEAIAPFFEGLTMRKRTNIVPHTVLPPAACPAPDLCNTMNDERLLQRMAHAVLRPIPIVSLRRRQQQQQRLVTPPVPDDELLRQRMPHGAPMAHGRGRPPQPTRLQPLQSKTPQPTSGKDALRLVAQAT